MATFPSYSSQSLSLTCSQGNEFQQLIPVLDAAGHVVDLTTAGPAGGAAAGYIHIFPINPADATESELDVAITPTALGAQVALTQNQTNGLRLGNHAYKLTVEDAVPNSFNVASGAFIVNK